MQLPAQSTMQLPAQPTVQLPAQSRVRTPMQPTITDDNSEHLTEHSDQQRHFSQSSRRSVKFLSEKKKFEEILIFQNSKHQQKSQDVKNQKLYYENVYQRPSSRQPSSEAITHVPRVQSIRKLLSQRQAGMKIINEHFFLSTFQSSFHPDNRVVINIIGVLPALQMPQSSYASAPPVVSYASTSAVPSYAFASAVFRYASISHVISHASASTFETIMFDYSHKLLQLEKNYKTKKKIHEHRK